MLTVALITFSTMLISMSTPETQQDALQGALSSDQVVAPQAVEKNLNKLPYDLGTTDEIENGYLEQCRKEIEEHEKNIRTRNQRTD